MSKLKTPCVIFAGGKSSRMGEDKSMLPFGEYSSLSEFLYAKMSEIFEDVYISAKTKDKFGFNAKFIEDIKLSDESAPTLGLYSCCEYFKRGKFFVLSVDTPFITEEIVSKLLESSDDYEICVASTNSGIQPMCGVYCVSLKDKFKEMVESNNHRLGKLIKTSNAKLVEFNDEEKFMNLNYKDEYEKALKIHDKDSN